MERGFLFRPSLRPSFRPARRAATVSFGTPASSRRLAPRRPSRRRLPLVLRRGLTRTERDWGGRIRRIVPPVKNKRRFPKSVSGRLLLESHELLLWAQGKRSHHKLGDFDRLLLTKRGWTLSPAFDLNPTGFRRQSLLIDGKTEASNLEVLRKSAARYFLKQQRAERILDEVLAAVCDWRSVADELALLEWERELFSGRFLCT